MKTTSRVCDRCYELTLETVRVSGQTLCEECHDVSIVFCSICGDACFGDPDKVFVCSSCLEHTDGIVGTYRLLWELSRR